MIVAIVQLVVACTRDRPNSLLERLHFRSY